MAKDSGEFRNIFDRPATGSQLREIEENLAKARAGQYSIPVATAALRAADSFLSAYRLSAPGFITLIGHNKGGLFYFPDGSTFNLSRLDRADVVTAVISCESSLSVNGAAIGLPDEITYTVAFAIEQNYSARLNISLAGGQPVAARTAQGLLDLAYGDALTQVAGAKNRVRAYRVAGLGGTAVVGVAVYNTVPNS